MEYNQFRQLLDLKGIREKETVSQLEDFIRQFPFCQTSRLLLAKALHDQNSIHYDRSLKLAAAYASNREMLRDLIDRKSEETEYEFPLPSKEIVTESKTVSSGIAQELPGKKEERFEEWYSEDEISGRAFIEQKEKEKLVDPHEVIRQRLNEIISGADVRIPDLTISKKSEEIPKEEVGVEIKPEAEQPPPASVEAIAKEEVKEEKISHDAVTEAPLPGGKKIPVHEPSQNLSTESKIIAQAENAKDDLDRMELEHAMEESILESLTHLPVIAPEKKFGEEIYKDKKPALKNVYVGDRHSPRTFSDWLKLFQPGSAVEEKTAAPVKPAPMQEENLPEEVSDPESRLSDDELIEKFLLEDPKIVPSKAEFYSPVNQAKKSVMDHDDVVSETLARIYLSQGNTRKARWCFERLILLHPEKSTFFAALLNEIEDHDNNKEDL